jgi:hypothetical protein
MPCAPLYKCTGRHVTHSPLRVAAIHNVFLLPSPVVPHARCTGVTVIHGALLPHARTPCGHPRTRVGLDRRVAAPNKHLASKHIPMPTLC